MPVRHMERQLPPGYSFPTNPHLYYPRDDEYNPERAAHHRDHSYLDDSHPYQYHPMFAENELGPAAAQEQSSPLTKTGSQYPEEMQKAIQPGPGHTPYRQPTRDVLPTDPRYRGFGAPYNPYMPSPYGLPMTMGYGPGLPSYMQPRSLSMPGAYPPPQMTMPYGRPPAQQGTLTGFDVYGRPIYS